MKHFKMHNIFYQSFNTGQNSFTDSDIEDGMMYFYRVRAADYS